MNLNQKGLRLINNYKNSISSITRIVKWPMLVFAAGILSAVPFLTTGPVGTSEAYNYSLALADTITQIREGQFPVLAGQSEYAFNGRVHPIRTAPYLNYSAALLDLMTFRQLEFWTLQNLILSLSLVSGALSCFWGLSKKLNTPASVAAILSCLYILSPPVLAAAYGMDLYMTVTTVPFLPIIIIMCTKAFTGLKFSDYLALSTSLALCWLAHPPIALWVSIIAAIIFITASWFCVLKKFIWVNLFISGLIFISVAGFGFASALTITEHNEITKSNDHLKLFDEVISAFPNSLQPISQTANKISDFQLGYTVWGMFFFTITISLLRKNITSLVLLCVATFLLSFTVPVPFLHKFLWDNSPSVIFYLTNQWPMQRLYLPITILIIVSFAVVWRPIRIRSGLLHDALRLILIISILWTTWQSSRFISRGLSTQNSQEAIHRGHINGNINLTSISYALIGAPSYFVNGVMDPAFEFRLLAPYDARILTSNWVAKLPNTSESSKGTFSIHPNTQVDILNIKPPLILKPGERYRLTLNFIAPPTKAVLQMIGPTMFREYSLPTAGGSNGFGMNLGNNNVLTLWTSQTTSEEVKLRLVGPNLANSQLAGAQFAHYNLERLDSAKLPIQLESLIPIKAKVSLDSPGYLETPRLYIPGYEATVNGVASRVQRSPEGMVMFAVPSGESIVELKYSGLFITRLAFWISIFTLFTIILIYSTIILFPNLAQNLAHKIKTSRNHYFIVLSALIFSGCIIYFGINFYDSNEASGPIRIRFTIPIGQTNRHQPLLVTGKAHQGMFVYIVYHDSKHVRIGVDVWGLLGFESDPILTDYYADHEIIIEAGSIYPKNGSIYKGKSDEEIKRIKSQLSINFNGLKILHRQINTYESKLSEITIGQNTIGGSSCEPNFTGQILSVDRLPMNSRNIK
jgi:hypothetical protein